MWPDEYPGTFSTQPRRGRRTLVAAAKRVDRTLTRFITASYSERPKPAGVVVVRGTGCPRGARFGGYVAGAWLKPNASPHNVTVAVADHSSRNTTSKGYIATAVAMSDPSS